MKNKIRYSRGATLLEIIIAIAILSIIVISLLSVFGSSITGIFGSGNRSNMLMDVQKIADDIQAQNDTPPGLDTKPEIETYMNSKSYNEVASLAQLNTWNGTNNINYFVEAKTITSVSGLTADGFEVTIVKFFHDGEKNCTAYNFCNIGDLGYEQNE